ncbi:MAG: phosphoribosylformimino-5-aminoimidazole carboxamide ribotide isomerase [Eubacterium sp.]|nr:phosphoribosylformimino-5-aminoimidazole carboxamide ribotide isomerase [Eubacterium sp.]
MKFRPCIDIHNGKVKQIVGSSLSDGVIGDDLFGAGRGGDGKESSLTAKSSARENFVSDNDGAFFGNMYREMNLPGGHIILLNPAGTEEYEADIEQARLAMEAFPGGLMIGGGITAENAERFLDMGATHVIVTSYVFKNGRINMERLEKLRSAVGRDRLVLDLSCRRRKTAIDVEGNSGIRVFAGQNAAEKCDYYIVTDRWQKFTDVPLNLETLDMFSEYSSEFLIHAVDVEGKARGIETQVASLLGGWGKLPVTYAGGVSSFEDLEALRELGQNRLDVTIGSALSIFGGSMDFEEVVRYLAEA